MDDNRIGDWLRETRLRQVMPGKRKPWSQDYLIAQMEAAIKWAPHRPNYSKYETGKSTPEPDTLDKFIAFWTGRGEPGPDLSPKPEPEPTVDPLVAALAAQTKAINDLVGLLRPLVVSQGERLVDLELVVRALAGPKLEGSPKRRVPAATAG